MRRELEEWLNDIVAAGQEIRSYVEGLEQDDFERDMRTVRAVAYLMLSIGEAAKNLPQDFIDQHEEIDWRGIKGMRDILAHRYFGLDIEIIWETVTTHLPAIILRIEQVLGEE